MENEEVMNVPTEESVSEDTIAAQEPTVEAAPAEEEAVTAMSAAEEEAVLEAEALEDGGDEEAKKAPAPKRRPRVQPVDSGEDPGEDKDGNQVSDEAQPQQKEPKKPTKTRAQMLREQDQKREERDRTRAERQLFLSGLASLQDAARRKRIVSGEIAGVSEISIAGTKHASGLRKSTIAFSIFVDGKYKVLIPFEEFYRDNPIDASTVNLTTNRGVEEYLNRMRQMAVKCIGADVDFMISGIAVKSADDYAIVGSRKDALMIQETVNFVGTKNSAPRLGAPPRDDPNVVSEAVGKVLSVGPHALTVCVGGVDTQMQLRQITYRYTLDLTEDYQPGDEISVAIRAVKPRGDGRVRLEVDARDAELRDAKRRQERGDITEGTFTVGTILTISPSKKNPGRMIITAYLDSFNMPATVTFAGATGNFQQGDKVRVRVAGFATNGFVICSGRGLMRSSIANR